MRNSTGERNIPFRTGPVIAVIVAAVLGGVVGGLIVNATQSEGGGSKPSGTISGHRDLQ